MLGTLAMEDARNYYIDLGRTRAILPKATKSTFSPFNSFKILAILDPLSPIQVPIGSILSLVEDTATLLLTPASRDIEGEESTDEEGNIIYLDPEINEDAQLLLEERAFINSFPFIF